MMEQVQVDLLDSSSQRFKWEENVFRYELSVMDAFSRLLVESFAKKKSLVKWLDKLLRRFKQNKQKAPDTWTKEWLASIKKGKNSRV